MYGDLSNVRILTLDPAKDPEGGVIRECVERYGFESPIQYIILSLMTDLSKRYSSISIRLEDFRHSMYICLRIHRTTALSHFSRSHASSFTHSRLSLQLSHICAPSVLLSHQKITGSSSSCRSTGKKHLQARHHQRKRTSLLFC